MRFKITAAFVAGLGVMPVPAFAEECNVRIPTGIGGTASVERSLQCLLDKINDTQSRLQQSERAKAAADQIVSNLQAQISQLQAAMEARDRTVSNLDIQLQKTLAEISILEARISQMQKIFTAPDRRGGLERPMPSDQTATITPQANPPPPLMRPLVDNQYITLIPVGSSRERSASNFNFELNNKTKSPIYIAIDEFSAVIMDEKGHSYKGYSATIRHSSRDNSRKEFYDIISAESSMPVSLNFTANDVDGSNVTVGFNLLQLLDGRTISYAVRWRVPTRQG